MVFDKLKNFKTEFLSCSGRARRGEYWATAIIFCLPQMVLNILASIIACASGSVVTGAIIMIIVGCLGLVMLPVQIRRWHDLGFTGWIAIGVMLVNFIPILGWLATVAAFVFMCIPGTKGPNAYGADPLDPAAQPVAGAKSEPMVPFMIAGAVCVIINVVVASVKINNAIKELDKAFNHYNRVFDYDYDY